MTDVRVRIAPSPTGYLHVGTARTALYNYLYAKHNGGKFVLRIEDTDRERSTDEMTDIIIEGLKWLGINWDEGPVFQSDFFQHYRDFIPRLIESGNVYKCFCTQEELAQRREKAIAEKKAWKYDRKCAGLSADEVQKRVDAGEKFVYRVRIPEGKTVFDDLIHGPIERANTEIEDFVIFRSDMTPIYNFAVVIDDLRMKISHVIRGDDHISNTFKQIHIYSILGETPPRFGHMPLILDADKKKLSKRSGTVSVLAFRDMGILPEAFVNFIALIGWNPGGDEEYFTMNELIEKFTLDRVTKKGGVFDTQKLEWMNATYITRYDRDDLLDLLEPFYADAGINLADYDSDWMKSIIKSVQEKARYLKDFPALTDFYFNDVKEYEEKGMKKFITEQRIEYLKVLMDKLSGLDDFSEHNIEDIYRKYAEEKELKGADIIHPTRLALTGVTVGPSLFELMGILGKDIVLQRLTKFIQSAIL